MFLWVFGVFINVYVWDTHFLHPYRLFQAGFILTSFVGLISKNEKVHLALPILTIIILLASQFVVRMQIGALIRS